MDEVHYEEQEELAILQSERDGEWLSSDAIVELEAWK